jgi:hypothetical protein
MLPLCGRGIPQYVYCWHTNRTESRKLLLEIGKPDALVIEIGRSGFVDYGDSQGNPRRLMRKPFLRPNVVWTTEREDHNTPKGLRLQDLIKGK